MVIFFSLLCVTVCVSFSNELNNLLQIAFEKLINFEINCTKPKNWEHAFVGNYSISTFSWARTRN